MRTQGELEVIIDVIRNLEERSNLTHQFVPRAALSGGTTSSAGQAALLAALTAETVRNIGRKQTALKDAASRLRRGAAALRVVVEREDAFYRELSSLQGHWKVSDSVTNNQCC